MFLLYFKQERLMSFDRRVFSKNQHDETRGRIPQSFLFSFAHVVPLASSTLNSKETQSFFSCLLHRESHVLRFSVFRIHHPPAVNIELFPELGSPWAFWIVLAFAESPVLFPFPSMFFRIVSQRKEKALDGTKAMDSWVRIPYFSSGRGPWRKS